MLLGLDEESKAYRLYDPVEKKIIIRRDVLFDEEKSWDWDQSYDEHIMADIECGDEGDTRASMSEEAEDIPEELDAEVIKELTASPQPGENGRESPNPLGNP